MAQFEPCLPTRERLPHKHKIDLFFLEKIVFNPSFSFYSKIFGGAKPFHLKVQVLLCCATTVYLS